MKIETRLSLGKFDTVSPPRCKATPGLIAHKKNCLLCVYTKNREYRIGCSRFPGPVTTGQKYSLKKWKSARCIMLGRDGHQCVIYDRKDGLHIHHIDRDTTNDDPSNLVTHCNFCNSHTHIEIHRVGGADRVQGVTDHYRMQREWYTRGHLRR